MKKLFLFAILISAISANSQSLKETLYSGKLKTDTGTTIRKGEDLSSKIDTSTKKPVEQAKVAGISQDSLMSSLLVAKDSAVGGVAIQNNNTGVDAANAAAESNAAATKDNNTIWKEYIDQFVGEARTEIMPNKKIRDGSYSVLIEYEIGLDGQITINSVNTSPESSTLAQQIKNRMELTVPKMSPLLTANGKPRKAIKKQTITLSK
jgi:hypothetical protein